MATRLGGFALVILGLLTMSGTAAWADKRIALVIGNSNYNHVPSLPNPANDAASITTLLRNAGFDVVEGHRDLGVAPLRQAIRQFAAAASDADVALVYFAGHGIEVDGNNYLIPVDARLASDFDVEDETISLERVLKAIEPAKRLRFIILDACRDNPFAKTMKRSVASRSIGRGLAKVEPTSSDTLIAFAAKAGSTASDGDGANSPFAAALVKHIATPGLDLRIALGRVRDDVLASTKRQQEPFVYGSLGGSVVAIVPSAAAPSDTAAAPPAPTAVAPKPAEPPAAVAVVAPPAAKPALGRGLGSFAGVTIEVAVHELQTEVHPRPGTNEVRRTIAVYLKDADELPTKITALGLQARISRDFNFVGALDATDGRAMIWSLKGNQLTGTLSNRIMVWKQTIELKGNTCTATVTYQPPAGQSQFKLVRLNSGELVTVASITPKTVTCRVIAGDKVGAQ